MDLGPEVPKSLVSDCETVASKNNQEQYKVYWISLLSILVGSLLVAVPILSHLILRLVLWGKYYYSQFLGNKTESQRAKWFAQGQVSRR